MSDPHEEVDEPDAGISTLPPAAPDDREDEWVPLRIRGYDDAK